ncbi:MAG: STAS domain-containing protein [Oscillochloris sp.]|nr:STAS domain-containing protein [Oscillochloris sp.]
MLSYMRSALDLLARPVHVLRGYSSATLRVDLLAGITVGTVLIPQALAFSLLAGMPPITGLYAAIVAAIVGALWGSSSHLHSGPTNTASILTLSVLLPIAQPGTSEFIVAAGMIAVMAGLIRLAMGLARLGVLINFVSDSVAVGFTAGAGVLIMVNQLAGLLRLNLGSGSPLETVGAAIERWNAVHLPSLAIGIATIVLIVLVPYITRKLPSILIAIAVVSLAAWGLDLQDQGVRMLDAVPVGLPPINQLPIFDLELIGHLANGALALAIIGLVEAVAISRAISGYTQQRIDSNQEFVGQGMANILSGIFSGYPTSGSFNRSALSYRSGAQTAMTAVFSGLFVLLAAFFLGSLLTHLPQAALAGALVVTAYSMIDRRTIVRIWRSARGDMVIMSVTLLATLLLPLQFAVLIGVLMSLGRYLMRTSTPRVEQVLPDPAYQHWTSAAGRLPCPQLVVIDILGDLYFGAVNHVEERILAILARQPNQRYMLLRMQNVQHCDISGIIMLEQLLHTLRAKGGDLFLVRVRTQVHERMQSSGLIDLLGDNHLLDDDAAIGHLFHHVLDPAICIYECDRRAFKECQNLPKRHLPELPKGLSSAIPAEDSIPTIMPQVLWERLHSTRPPLIIDVREPREFRQGRIPGARSEPLADLAAQLPELPKDRPIVLICRSGRRSLRAAALLMAAGYHNVSIVAGGMLDWEARNLLNAVGDQHPDEAAIIGAHGLAEPRQ